jgi:hypothetical protein
MARTSDAAVRAVLRSSSAAATFTSEIATATALVDARVAASADFAALGSTLLERIEAYIAAHFAAIANPEWNLSSLSRNGSSESVRGETGRGLSATLWGQTAMQIDTTGTLAAADAAASGAAGSAPVSASVVVV